MQYQLNNEYVEKIKRCYSRVLTEFMPTLEMLKPSEDTVEVMTKKASAIHAFKLLKEKHLDNQAFEKDDNDYSEIDDNSNIVIHPEDDPEIKYFKSFCKALSLCYPLTLNWNKIPCPYSKTIQPWREEHENVSRRYFKLLKQSIHCHLDHPTCLNTQCFAKLSPLCNW